MGNNLCKERIDGASNSKNPIDRLLGRCAQICPSLHKETKWNKHVFETCPPQHNQPRRSDSWRNATLTVPTDDGGGGGIGSIGGGGGGGKKDIQPIAPPRQKRRSSSFANGFRPIRNGFKDVFNGNNDDRRYSQGSIISRGGCPLNNQSVSTTAVITSADDSPSNRNSDDKIVDIKLKTRSFSTYDIPMNDDFSDFSKETPIEIKKNLPKVGNKKSDKFFGENLSDCLAVEIIEPKTNIPSIELQKDQLDKFIENNVISPAIIEAAVTRTTEKKVRSPPPEPPKRKPSQNKELNKLDEVVSVTEGKHEEVNSKTSSLDRRAEFLMAMLSGETGNAIVDEPDYSNRVPVEEPLMVIKKHPKNCPCCDDVATLRKHLHRHEQKVEEADETEKAKTLSSLESAPQKPQRDFNKYRESLEMSDSSLPDLSIFGTTESNSTIARPARIKNKRSVSREDLPSPPPRPNKKPLDKSPSPPQTPSKIIKVTPPMISLTLSSPVPQLKSQPVSPRPITPQKSSETPRRFTFSGHNRLHRNISMPVAPQEQLQQIDLPDDKLAAIFKKCKSSNSFLTQELMDQIIKKAYGFGFDDDYWSEHHYDLHDGSSLVAPSSKLVARKISVGKKSSLESLSEIDDRNKPPSFSIGSKKIQVTSVEPNKVELRNDIEERKPSLSEINFTKLEKVVEQPEIPIGESSSISKKKENTLNAVVQSKVLEPSKELTHNRSKSPRTSTPTSQVESNLLTNIDEENIGSLLEASGLNIDTLSNVLEDIYKSNKTILEDFQSYLEQNRDETDSNDSRRNFNLRRNEFDTDSNISLTKRRQSELMEISSVASTFGDSDLDKEDLDLIDDTDESSENQTNEDEPKLMGGKKLIRNKLLLDSGRRDSIVDMDQWFTEHLESPFQNRSVSDIIHGTQKGRRGSEGMIVYDTSTIFPFSKVPRERTISESNDFFEDSDSNTVVKAAIEREKTKEREKLDVIQDHDQDHSKLLKILQRESPTK